MRTFFKKNYIILAGVTLLVVAGHLFLLHMSAESYRTTNNWSGTFILQDTSGDGRAEYKLEIPHKDGSFPITLSVSDDKGVYQIVGHGERGQQGQLDVIFDTYGDVHTNIAPTLQAGERLFSLEVTDEPFYVVHWDTFHPETGEYQDFFNPL